MHIEPTTILCLDSCLIDDHSRVVSLHHCFVLLLLRLLTFFALVFFYRSLSLDKIISRVSTILCIVFFFILARTYVKQLSEFVVQVDQFLQLSTIFIIILPDLALHHD